MTYRSATPLRFFAFLALLQALSCAGGGSSSASGGGGIPPPANCQNPLPTPIANPHFSTDLLPILQATCGSASASCHGAVTVPNGHFSFSTASGRTAQNVFNDLVNVAPSNAPAGYMRIKPGDVAHSWVIEKVSSDQPGGLGYGARMPYAGSPLCQSTIDNLKTWVQNGAPF